MQEWVIQIPSIPILVSVLFPSLHLKYFRIKFLLLVFNNSHTYYKHIRKFHFQEYSCEQVGSVTECEVDDLETQDVCEAQEAQEVAVCMDDNMEEEGNTCEIGSSDERMDTAQPEAETGRHTMNDLCASFVVSLREKHGLSLSAVDQVVQMNMTVFEKVINELQEEVVSVCVSNNVASNIQD